VPSPGPLAGQRAVVETPRPAVAWREVARLVPAHRDVVPQYAVQLGDGGWGLTQGRDNGTGRNATDDLILSRFDKACRLIETRTIPRGGHGDHTAPQDGKLTTRIKGIWASVNFGSPWSWRGTYATPLCPVRPRSSTSLQGEAYAGGQRWLRLYGQSMKGGAERDPSHAYPFLEVIEGDRLLRTHDLRKVPLDAKGLPIGGRYEPEGVSLGVLDGVKVALVGFSVGRLGGTTMRVYACPLAAL
jgi:hypothetical protein